jgi:hypothetical protein
MLTAPLYSVKHGLPWCPVSMTASTAITDLSVLTTTHYLNIKACNEKGLGSSRVYYLCAEGDPPLVHLMSLDKKLLEED